MKSQNSLWKFIVVILLVSTLLNGCAAGATESPTETPLPAPTDTQVPPTDTPVPTDTPTPLPTDTPTPLPTATATPDLKATKAAIAQATTDAMSAGIQEELSTLGLPTEGKLAWHSDEAKSMTLTAYNTYDFLITADSKEFHNFVMKVDVTWESKSGLAICGLIFRAEKNIANGDYYLFQALRLSGLPAWDFESWDNGSSWTVLGSVQTNTAIDQAQGATNAYVLYVDGDNMSVYANGTRLGTANYTKRGDGVLAYFISQESGETTCTFNNAWVWELP